MAHFNRERIPERIVHAKGSGAYGYFICNNPDMPKFAAAKLFSAVGKKSSLSERMTGLEIPPSPPIVPLKSKGFLDSALP